MTTFFLAMLQGDIVIDNINKTHILLISKVSKPKSIAQFQPISLSTMLYKIIAKVVVNRMSGCLDCCIHEAQ